MTNEQKTKTMVQASAKAYEELIRRAKEIAMLESKKRLALGWECREWIEAALSASRVRLAPLDPEIAVLSTRLPEFPHSDPADRIIVATATVMDWKLVTADQAVLRYLETRNQEAIAL